MSEPKAITFKEVKKAVGDEGSLEAWWKIGEITGAGKLPTGIDGDGSIDVTELSTGKLAQIDRLLGKEDEVVINEAAPKKSTKDGAK